MNNLHICFSFI